MSEHKCVECDEPAAVVLTATNADCEVLDKAAWCRDCYRQYVDVKLAQLTGLQVGALKGDPS